MPRYVGRGARTDCGKLIKRFAELKTMRYEEFTKVWRDTKFSYIYFGHNTLEELIEFTEEVFRVAKELWLKSENMNEQAGGLYTLYGLYLKQPTDGLVKIRLTPHDYELVEKFHEAVKAGHHYDVNYIYARMHVIGAFRFCVSNHSYGLEKVYRKYHEIDRSLAEVKEEPFYVKKLRNNDVFLKLDNAFKEYHKSKCKLVSGNSKTPPTLLDYVDSDFGHKLKENFQKITQSPDEPASKEDDSNVPVSKVNDKSVSSSSKSHVKLPWWMLQVHNRLPEQLSSSESEAENDIDSVNCTSKRNSIHSKQEARDALIVALGMSGDEGEDPEESVELQTPGPSCSHDMPTII